MSSSQVLAPEPDAAPRRSLSSELARGARLLAAKAQGLAPRVLDVLKGMATALATDWTLVGPTVVNLPLSRGKRWIARIAALIGLYVLVVIVATNLSAYGDAGTAVPLVTVAILTLLPLLLLPAGALIAWRSTLIACYIMALWQWPMFPVTLVVILGVLTLLAARARPLNVAIGMWVLIVIGAVAFSIKMAEWTAASAWYAVAAAIGAGLLCWTGQALRGRSTAQIESQHDRAVAVAEEERGLVLKERARIARELHDIVTHHMSGVAIEAQAAPLRDPDLSDESRAAFATIERTSRQALADLRTVIGMLRDDDTVELREPQPSLRNVTLLVDRARELGQEVNYAVDIQRAVPEAISLAGYRIIQESLTNARRHARGMPVTLTVSAGEQALTLRVSNTVPGDTEMGETGHGIPGMRERAEALGGSFTAGVSESGFEVRAELPLPKDDE